jgi:hypothetical protein
VTQVVSGLQNNLPPTAPAWQRLFLLIINGEWNYYHQDPHPKSSNRVAAVELKGAAETLYAK